LQSPSENDNYAWGHKTVTMIDLPSPNCDARPLVDGIAVDTLIMHYTGMQNAPAAIERLRDSDAKVSSHYVVDEDGTITRLVAEEMRAYHAGLSYWRGRRALNDVSIGIEIVNPGHEFGYRRFPMTQMQAVLSLSQGILARHNIPAHNIIGHSDVAPNRKQDPGELFDWRFLAENGVGIWPAGIETAGLSTDMPVADAGQMAANALHAIGYDIDAENPDADLLVMTLIAFQRHWRQGNVNGCADDGTIAALRMIRNAIA
jgi:N-acetylmuramoyl-L-alanine amidase